MEIFYGIVTTTLVVLSSFTLAIFQFFATAIIKKAKDSHNRLSRYTNSENELTHQCDATAIYDLTAQYDRLKNSFKLLERNFEREFFLLLIVVFGFNYKKSKKLTFVSIIKYFVRYFYPG
jgi:hypothetical protein